MADDIATRAAEVLARANRPLLSNQAAIDSEVESWQWATEALRNAGLLPTGEDRRHRCKGTTGWKDDKGAHLSKGCGWEDSHTEIRYVTDWAPTADAGMGTRRAQKGRGRAGDGTEVAGDE